MINNLLFFVCIKFFFLYSLSFLSIYPKRYLLYDFGSAAASNPDEECIIYSMLLPPTDYPVCKIFGFILYYNIHPYGGSIERIMKEEKNCIYLLYTCIRMTFLGVFIFILEGKLH
jgi:hypothetical protein